MSTNAAVLQLYLNGAYATVPLYAEKPVRVTKGMDPYGTWPSPSRFECEINNDSLDYDPTRPAALLYGIAGRNTMARLTVNSVIRLVAEASSYVPERSIEHVSGAGKGRSSVAFTASGMSERLGLWEEPLRSPMYRTNSLRPTNIGHWSLEDDSASTRLANTAAGGVAGVFKSGVTLGESNSPDGAKSSAKVTDVSQMSGKFVTASNTAGWQVYFSFRMPAVPAGATYGELLSWKSSFSVRYSVSVNNNSYKFDAVAPDGTVLWSSFLLFGAGVSPDSWVTMKVRAEQVGGNIDIRPAWYAQGMTTSYGITDSFVSPVGRLMTWEQNGNSIVNGTWFSHIGGVTSVVDSLTGSTAQRVFNGYRGETAVARINRLGAENNVQLFQIGSSADSQPMGPQKPDPFMSLLKEAKETDDLRIDDERWSTPNGMTVTTRRALYAQAPMMTLAYPSQVAVPFKKTIGNRGVWNRVVVKQRDGGESSLALASGLMSTQLPPAGIGEIKKNVDVNVATDAQLDDLATWWLAKGTLARPRYESVTIDLLANPGLEAAAVLVREGHMVRVTGYEADPIDLLVVGIEELAGNKEHTITFKTEPYEPYQVGVWDDASFRWDSATSVLNTAQTTTTTVWSVKCADPDDVWSTTPGYQWMIGGERVTVTNMTAASATFPYTQTATVTRSVNGVVKAQTVGTEIHVADPKRWGL